MKCRKAGKLLSDRLDGALDGGPRRALEGHLRECPSCAAAGAELRRVRELLGEAKAPDPGPDYWAGFWPRIEARLDRGPEPAPSLAARLRAALGFDRFDAVISPAPALAIIALLCFNILLLAQTRMGDRRAAAAGRALSGPRADGRPGGAVWAARRGVDDVLCDHGGREGIDEYVLQPAAFRLPAGARGKTDYILTRASDPSPRGWARGAY